MTNEYKTYTNYYEHVPYKRLTVLFGNICYHLLQVLCTHKIFLRNECHPSDINGLTTDLPMYMGHAEDMHQALNILQRDIAGSMVVLHWDNLAVGQGHCKLIT